MSRRSGAGPVYLIPLEGSVLFQSRESRNLEGGPVYNRVQLERQGDLDLWTMQQSHHGPSLPGEKWDRLAIVVNRKSGTARFYQLKPGSQGLKEEISFKVACYLCHANGPRAIRPDASSVAITWGERLRILAWNFRIKTYGRILPDPVHKPGSGFKMDGAFYNELLKVKTCTFCHNESSWGRGTLARQHFLPIRFLTKEGEMPPPGLPFPDHEADDLQSFLGSLGKTAS